MAKQSDFLVWIVFIAENWTKSGFVQSLFFNDCKVDDVDHYLTYHLDICWHHDCKLWQSHQDLQSVEHVPKLGHDSIEGQVYNESQDESIFHDFLSAICCVLKYHFVPFAHDLSRHVFDNQKRILSFNQLGQRSTFFANIFIRLWSHEEVFG